MTHEAHGIATQPAPSGMAAVHIAYCRGCDWETRPPTRAEAQAALDRHLDSTDRNAERVAHLEEGLRLIIAEAEHFPGEDGIGAGVMARNLLRFAPGWRDVA